MTISYLPPGPDPLLTHQAQSWRVDILSGGVAVDTLTSVTGGRVEHNASRVLHAGGLLDVTDVGQVTDWLDLQVRVWWQVAGADAWPLGTFLCSAPGEQHTEHSMSWSVELLDRLTILDADAIDAALALPTGTVVTDAVQSVIAGSGETSVSITASTETLTAPMMWAAGTSRLRIVNDMLAAINYFALRTDMYGAYIAAPYVAPGDRAVVRDLTADAIVTHDWTRDQDLARVPNRAVLVGQGAAGTESLVGTAENVDPASRLSISNRGRVVTATVTGVEATSQAVIDALAARKLTELSTPSATREIAHTPVPVGLHDVVMHAGTRGAVQSWGMALEVGALMKTRLWEVS